MGRDLGEFVVSEESRRRRVRRRVWVQHVAVEADRLQLQVEAARRGQLTAQQAAVADGVMELIENARSAALGDNPRPRRIPNWWRGALVEASYLNLHAARAQIVDLYDLNDLRAEIPVAVAKARETLNRDDPRRVTAEHVLQTPDLPAEQLRPVVRRLISDSYEKGDREHAQLRSFRNILLIAAVSMFVLVAITVGVVAWKPDWMPLCFTAGDNTACPTSFGPKAHAEWPDILMVALLGALGGALTASLSIRNLKGTSTPYDVPVALAMLKVPLGAFTAMLALVAIRGSFVPGLSSLDSQEQILAYALAFGFAQQALSRVLDQRAQTLLEGLPGGTAKEPTPGGPTTPPPPTEQGETGKAPAKDTNGADVEIPPAGDLPEDVDVIPVVGAEPGDQQAEEEGEELHAPGATSAPEPGEEPLQTPAEQPPPDLLPDEDQAEFFEDDLAQTPAGPDAPDGIEFPTAETEE